MLSRPYIAQQQHLLLQQWQKVKHENEQLQQHIRLQKQLCYQNHPYWVLAAAATAAAARVTATAA